MAYASIDDVRSRTTLEVNETICEALLEDASIIIDSFNDDADEEIKCMVACRMVLRALPNEDASFPIGANQGTISALGYSQTWTMSNSGTVGELYLTKQEKKLLGGDSFIGSHSPLENFCDKRH